MLYFRNFAALFLAFFAHVLAIAPAEAIEKVDLSPQIAADDVARISVTLEAGGHNLVRLESSGDKNDVAAEQKLPTSVSAKLEYHERRINAGAAELDDRSPLAVRYYERAEAVLKVDDGGREPRLADDRRLIVLASGNPRPILYSPEGPLPREQLDLIDILGNTFFADALLPSEPVAKGDSWGHQADLMVPLLALDSAAVCEVQSNLEGYNASFAKLRLAGVIHGMADGAATELEVRAVYLFNRKLRRITRMNLAVREKRSLGAATPGLEAVAKLQINIEPSESLPHLSDQQIAKAMRAGRTDGRDLLYEAPPLGFRVQHDRQWFVTGEQRESVVLRRVDQGDLVAQCTLSVLPPKSAGRQTSLEEFQKDVTYSLGKSFGELVSSRQWQNAAGHYCYELVVRGVVEEVPVEWHYYLVAPESGHRVSAVVTTEKPMVERLAGADRELVESLELFPRMPAAQTAARPTGEPVQ